MEHNIKKEISESEEKLKMFRSMVESAHDAIFFKDLESRYIIVNDKTLEAFGLSREDVIGKNDLEITSNKVEAKKNIEDDQYVFKTGKKKEISKHMTGEDGKEYWFQAIKVPQYDHDGNIIGLVGVARDITERKKMEAELEEKVREMNTFINNIPHMAWLKDTDSNFILVNKAFGDVVGMKPEDLKNHTCAVCFGVETANKFREDDLVVIEGKKQITLEETIVDISGKERYLETTKAPIFNNTGDVIGTVGIAIDITERKQMEEELRKHREQKYKLITENIYDHIVILNEAYEVEYINESVTRRLGYTKKELIGKSSVGFIHPEDGKELMLNFRKGYSEDESQNILRSLHKEGYWVWLEARTKTFIDVDGKLKALVVARDITERRKAEQELLKSEQIWRDSFNSLEDIMFIINKDYIIEKINKGGLVHLGKSKEEVIGKKCYEIIHNLDKPKNFCPIKKSLNTKKVESVEIYEKKFDKYYSIKGNPIFDENGEIIRFVELMIDITERRKAEEMVKEALEQSDFYKDLLAHDMGNILNNIKSSIYIQEMWKDDSEKLAKRRGMLNIAKQQVKRGASLISNVRKLSELEGADQNIKSVDLMNTLKNAIEHIHTQFLVKEIEIENETPQISFNIEGGDLLIDAFENILINGAFHNDNKKIKLWVKSSKVQEEGLNFVKIEFKDNGIGIIDERKKDIFKRNYKKDRNTGGMGLGLSLVKKIISSYGGQVWVEDRVEGDYAHGSNFVILLKEA